MAERKKAPQKSRKRTAPEHEPELDGELKKPENRDDRAAPPAKDPKSRSGDPEYLPPAVKTPIVAIGASAGGLEALQLFFSNMPVDSGIGFVVITHIKPHRESLLPELIANVTDISVTSGEESTRIEANRIVVAKDSLLTISNGVLHHVKQDDMPEVSYHPIDYFFRALADDQKEYAIGVILSGSGNDGTLGIKAIKAAGGMAMVQDPDTAKYAGMPDSAITTGLVDFVLSPESLPEALVQYCRGPFLKLSHRKENLLLPDEAIHGILVRLRSHTGQDFTSYKKSTMSRRIERRMNVHRIEGPRDYLRFLRENPRELDILLQELLISVTSFFRDPEAFEALAQKAIPKLLESREDGRNLRVWIPGCASGEETYSIAILLDEQIRRAEKIMQVQIFATDLDEHAIETARSGLYPEGIAADVSPERLIRYFSKEDGYYRIHKSIRDMVVFAIQNVISDPPFTRMDLIVCRNLLIYLDASAQQRLFPLFHYALKPGGMLFLGSSETPGESSRLFQMIDSRHKILRRLETSHYVYPQLPPVHRHDRDEPPDAPEARTGRGGGMLPRSIERLLLEWFVPCSIVVDEHDTVLYVHGRSGLYLEPEQGQPKNSLPGMAREGLKTALTAALRQIRQKKKAEVVQRGIQVKTNGSTTSTDMTVRALNAPENLRGLLLVTLQSSPLAEKKKPGKGAAPEKATEEPGLREQLEMELQYTRESLQSTIEELQTTNEELKSSNEELQSTNEELNSSNEELETSREEMQSLNEELNTVNAELTAKVEALARSNDDMNNLLNSMQVAIIFLDNQLRVKRYTQKARDLVKFIDTDIGRPLSDLTFSMDYPDLMKDCRRVLDSLIPAEKEVQDQDGRWHLVRMLPYRTTENVIDGLVMTIVDINNIKTAKASRDFFESIVDTVREPLLVLDGQLRVVKANEAFYHQFAAHPRQTEGLPVYELGSGQWKIPELRRLLEEIMPRDSVISDYAVAHDFPVIGRRTFLLNARRLKQLGQESDLILLGFEDATEKNA